MKALSTIRARLTMTTLLVAAGLAGLTIGTLSIAGAALRAAEFQKLTALRDVRAAGIVSYFATIENQVVSLSEDLMIVEAMEEFAEAFGTITLSQTESDAAGAAMERYVRGEYAPRIPESARPASSALTALVPAAPASKELQRRYIADNPSPVGAKEELDTAGIDGYDQLHARYHPVVRSFSARH